MEEKDQEIEELQRALEAYAIVPEEEEEFEEEEFAQEKQNNVLVDEQSELRISLRKRIAMASFTANEAYIPSGWQMGKEDYEEKMVAMELKLKAALVETEKTHQQLHERDRQLERLQQQIERQRLRDKKAQKVISNSKAVERDHKEQLESLKASSLMFLEEELEKQATLFQKRAEEAAAILEEEHAKDLQEKLEESKPKLQIWKPQFNDKKRN